MTRSANAWYGRNTRLDDVVYLRFGTSNWVGCVPPDTPFQLPLHLLLSGVKISSRSTCPDHLIPLSEVPTD